MKNFSDDLLEARAETAKYVNFYNGRRFHAFLHINIMHYLIIYFFSVFLNFWKYEDIYLNKYETISDARIGINKFTNFYNVERIHSSLEYKTPDEFYYNIVTEVKNTSGDLVLV